MHESVFRESRVKKRETRERHLDEKATKSNHQLDGDERKDGDGKVHECVIVIFVAVAFVAYTTTRLLACSNWPLLCGAHNKFRSNFLSLSRKEAD